MKFLFDALLVFLVMLIAAAIVAWGEPATDGDGAATGQARGWDAATLASLLGLR